MFLASMVCMLGTLNLCPLREMCIQELRPTSVSPRSTPWHASSFQLLLKAAIISHTCDSAHQSIARHPLEPRHRCCKGAVLWQLDSCIATLFRVGSTAAHSQILPSGLCPTLHFVQFLEKPYRIATLRAALVEVAASRGEVEHPPLSQLFRPLYPPSLTASSPKIPTQ
jgi:hypothetical protein